MIFFNKSKNFIKSRAELRRKYPLSSADVRCDCEKGLVSVILPVYNCEDYLDEAIISVLTQTYRHFELIIVDDGSTDKSGEIADSYRLSDSRIRVIHQQNSKLPSALNTGFDVANGEFLTWTSADNRMLPICLEVLTDELLRDRSSDMVFGNMQLINNNGEILHGYGWYEIPPLSGKVILPDDTSKLNTYANNTIGAAFLYRTGAARVIGKYSKDWYTLEDYDFFMRMNYTFSISHTIYKKPIYEYRIHKNSLTAHDDELGITASRPALMELDKKRRSEYQNPIFCYIDGNNKSCEKAISSKLIRIYSKKVTERLMSNVDVSFVYINLDNVQSTIGLNNDTPRFLITNSPTENSFGYTGLICRNLSKIKGNREWICPTNDTTLASYIFHKVKNM